MKFLIFSIVLLFGGILMLYTTIRYPVKIKEDMQASNLRGYIFGSMSIVFSVLLFLEYLNII